jgi:predicted RNase H-like HicB family nuclease
MSKSTISVLLIQEDGGWWSAQCLEHDIAAQAKSLSDVCHELEQTIIAHIAVHEAEGITPFDCLDPAPQEYWEMFHNAKLHGPA